MQFNKGYLTVYVSLTLTIMLSLCLTLIEGARRSTIRLETECITDVALNSIMAEYHREVFEQYNLFFIDSSYGTQYPSYYNTEARLKYYLEQNMNWREVSYIDFVYKDLLGMQVQEAYIAGVRLATDGDGTAFQKKAAAAVSDDIGLAMVDKVLDWVQTVETQGLLERDIAAEKWEADNKLQAYHGLEKQISEEKWITVEIKDPTQHLDNMRAQGTLKWVLEEGATISSQKVDLNQYICARRRRGLLNQGNVSAVEEVSVVEKILFHEYMIRYAGHYGKEKEGSLLKYQAEYLIAGKDKDSENLKQVVNTICGIREVANVIYLTQSADKMMVAEALSTVLAALVCCPEIAPIFKTILIIGWAYAESLYDTKVLLAGGKVPLMKEDATWHYDLDSILQSVNMQVRRKGNKGMCYSDYLHVLLYLAQDEQSVYRFMDLMEMDIRLTDNNSSFRMDGCIDYVEAQAVITSGYGYELVISRSKSY